MWLEVARNIPGNSPDDSWVLWRRRGLQGPPVNVWTFFINKIFHSCLSEHQPQIRSHVFIMDFSETPRVPTGESGSEHGSSPGSLAEGLWKQILFLEWWVVFHFLRCDWNNFGSYGKVTLRAFRNIKQFSKRLSHQWEIFDWVEDFAKNISNLCAGIISHWHSVCITVTMNPFANPLRFVCWRSPGLSWRFLIDD